MSTQRRTAGIYLSPSPRGPNGEKLCRNCASALPPNKQHRHNCSKKCTTEWMCKTSPNIARYHVWLRDKGVCALCSIDSVAGKTWKWGSPRQNRARGTGDLWQADHIKPVIEGGGECGLENLRTLCTACHKLETAALRRRISKEKVK